MKTPKQDWIRFLNEKEAGEVSRLLKVAGSLDAQREKVTDKLNRYRNRCIQRRKYREGKASNG